MRYRDNLPLVTSNLLRLIYMVGIGIVLQLYLKDLGASPFVISLSEVAFWGANLLFAPLWGALSDASGRRRAILVGTSFGAALLLPVFGMVDTVAGVLGLRFLFSAIAVGFPPVAIAAMSLHADTTRRGRSLSPYHTSRAVGFLLGWGTSGVILDLLGFGGAFTAFAAVGIAGGVAALLVRHVDTPEPVSAREVLREARKRWVPSRGDATLREDGLHWLLAAIFLRKVAFVGIFSLIAVYAVDVLGLRRALLGYVLAMNPLFQLLFIEFFATVADRRGRRVVLNIGFLATVPIPFMLLSAGNPLVFGAAYALLGFSFAAMVQGSTAFIGDVAPAGRQGELMGFRKSAQGLAGVAGPLLAGGLATVYGYRVMLVVMGLLSIAALLVVWWGTDESLDERSETTLRRDIVDSVWFLH